MRCRAANSGSDKRRVRNARRGARLRRYQATTLLELLITVAVISVLAGILLPAIQATRESARVLQCKDNARTIATALLMHHTDFKGFPHGGWGHRWVGVPDRASGRRQPGGWAY